MKKKVFIYLVLQICICTASFAQLGIEDCYLKAKTNYPLIKQYDLIKKVKDYNVSNAAKGYLPQFQLSAKATYQSQVTEIPINIPGIEGLSKDQYGSAIDLSQTIWDGGAINARKKVAETAAAIDEKQIDVSLYAINERINQLFFGILLFDEQLKQNQLYSSQLQLNYEQINAYVQNGIANEADLAVIKAEQVKAIQNKIQLEYNRKAYLEMLAAFIGENLNENVTLIKPDIAQTPQTQIQRPELDLFNAQLNNIDAKKYEINSTLMPKLGLFVTAGYGKPGLNMLNNKFSAYYIGGLRLSWNIGSFYTKKNNFKIIETSKNAVQWQRETFLFNTNIDIMQKSNEIAKTKELLAYDDEIILLRSSLRKSAEIKVANGTFSTIDLMREINAEDLAKQEKIMHEIQYILQIYNLKFTTNN